MAKRVWVLSDGKPGHRNQSLGVVEALGMDAEIKELKRRPLTGLLEKLNPIWGMQNVKALLQEQAPDILIATGTHLAPISAWFKAKNPQTYVVQIIPAGYVNKVDLAIAFTHDKPEEFENQLVLSTAPHRISKQKLGSAKGQFSGLFKSLKKPCLGVIIGGSNSKVKFDKTQAARLAAQVLEMADVQGFESAIITTSRRTGAEATTVLKALFEQAKIPVHFYDPMQDAAEDNPYLGILAHADALVVTAESFSMVSEALSSGKPTYLFGYRTWPLGKFKAAWDSLIQKSQLGCVHNPQQKPEANLPNSADAISEAIRKTA